ncbi:hypothetical protein [Listeria seeligeri]|uniref:hypothetical protein n=1 Tax=Listeria seeligeri TaxID=1640 RepID=UPI00162996F5|nr:hypothetical protein [Listeria seeligeri]EFU7331872.1 hypothetical protein [Listeria monocytogenes]MBC1479258.1 hypothetical protein [Listeria seeligeri]MBC1929561.1 hypothetical protein [Listeria seeligeri]MBC6113369.1 hypothetical protein [Listeria seeligeri]MBC6159472.1 hypothetical protein [Listeria seeligeri]
MKKILIVSLMLLTCMGILVACGEQNKYDEAIDSCIKHEFEYWKDNYSETEAKQIKRENAEIKVYDDGKYIKLKFPKVQYETEYKKDSDGNYSLPSSDEREYIENDAKLVYYEKKGKSQKIQK